MLTLLTLLTNKCLHFIHSKTELSYLKFDMKTKADNGLIFWFGEVIIIILNTLFAPSKNEVP